MARFNKKNSKIIHIQFFLQEKGEGINEKKFKTGYRQRSSAREEKRAQGPEEQEKQETPKRKRQVFLGSRLSEYKPDPKSGLALGFYNQSILKTRQNKPVFVY